MHPCFRAALGFRNLWTPERKQRSLASYGFVQVPPSKPTQEFNLSLSVTICTCTSPGDEYGVPWLAGRVVGPRTISSTLLFSRREQATCLSLGWSGSLCLVYSSSLCTCSALDLELFPPDSHTALYSPKRTCLTTVAQVASLCRLSPFTVLPFLS